MVNPDRTCANPRERRSSCPAMSPSGTSARTPSAPSSRARRSPQESNEVPIPFVRWSGSTKMNRSSGAPCSSRHIAWPNPATASLSMILVSRWRSVDVRVQIHRRDSRDGLGGRPSDASMAWVSRTIASRPASVAGRARYPVGLSIGVAPWSHRSSVPGTWLARRFHRPTPASGSSPTSGGRCRTGRLLSCGRRHGTSPDPRLAGAFAPGGGRIDSRLTASEVITVVMRYDPFREADRQMQQLLGRMQEANSTMAMDAYRRGDSLFVHFDLPGVDPGSIELTAEQNTLTVRADRRWDPEADDQILAQERPQGTFTRQLMLGEHLDTQHVRAAYEEGVLTIEIPIAPQAKPRKIEVRAGRQRQEAIDVEGTSSESASDNASGREGMTDTAQ